ncbi:MAG: FecR domain-containing protein [Gammaproteobacteria bacterium]|nr:FecR domain-containing protein [Gammaproteobacteria bacterium]
MHPTDDDVYPRRSSTWHRILTTFILVPIYISSFPASAESTVAGHVLTGNVQATDKSHSQNREVAGGEAFMSGETLSTQDKYAVIGFSDGTRITLRPNTEFVITVYHYGQGQSEALFKLNTGGIKVSTGKIAENTPSKFRVSTPYGNLTLPDPDIKGLVCTKGCDYDAAEPKNNNTHTGHIAFSKGHVTITRKDHTPVTSKAGNKLEKGDTIVVGRDGLAVLVLTNGQRKTLKSDESYTIK